jgi:hypothetical protein
MQRNNQTLKVIASGGCELVVDTFIARQCRTLKNLLEDLSDPESAVPLGQFDSETLRTFFSWLDHVQDPRCPPKLDKWEKALLDRPLERIVQLALAANFLDSPLLHERACMALARRCLGKTAREIRESFK